jgi:hypothetical protein
MVGNRSLLCRNHPDWLLHNTDGSLYCASEQYNEPKIWGYQDEEYYVLDTSHPLAMDYLKNVFRTLRTWGTEFFKTDFMLWGYVDSTQVSRYTPGKTSIEYFRDLLAVIREEIGENSYWLACIAPYLPFIGYADGMRVGGDVGYKWDSGFGPQNMIQSLWGENFTNNQFYQNDPDALILRDFHVKLTDTEAVSLALYAAVSGGCIYTSDPLHLLADERFSLLRFVKPDKVHRPKQPFLDEMRDDYVFTHSSGEKGIVFIFNRTDKPVTAVYCPERLGFDPSMKWFDYENRSLIRIEGDSIIVTVPPHGCKLFFLNRDGGDPDYEVLWNNL